MMNSVAAGIKGVPYLSTYLVYVGLLIITISRFQGVSSCDDCLEHPQMKMCSHDFILKVQAKLAPTTIKGLRGLAARFRGKYRYMKRNGYGRKRFPRAPTRDDPDEEVLVYKTVIRDVIYQNEMITGGTLETRNPYWILTPPKDDPCGFPDHELSTKGYYIIGGHYINSTAGSMTVCDHVMKTSRRDVNQVKSVAAEIANLKCSENCKFADCETEPCDDDTCPYKADPVLEECLKDQLCMRDNNKCKWTSGASNCFDGLMPSIGPFIDV